MPIDMTSNGNMDYGNNELYDGWGHNRLSIAVRIKVSTWNQTIGGILMQYVAFDNMTWAFGIQNLNERLTLQVGTNVTTGAAYVWDASAFPVDEWVNIVVTYNGSKAADEKMCLYMNGVEQTSITSAYDNNVNIPSTTNSIWVGKWGASGGNYFTGYLDELGVWSDELDVDDVLGHNDMLSCDHFRSAELVLHDYMDTANHVDRVHGHHAGLGGVFTVAEAEDVPVIRKSYMEQVAGPGIDTEPEVEVPEIPPVLVIPSPPESVVFASGLVSSLPTGTIDMTTILDYQGRRFDVMAFQGAQPAGRAKLRQELFGEDTSGTVATGVQKLAQRFVLELLTEKGSMTFLPDRGTEFMTQARNGTLRSEQAVSLAFNFALIDIRQNLLAEEELFNALEMQDDEKFSNAELQSITLIGDLLQLSAAVTSQAGTSRKVILPISTTPIDTSF